MSVRAAVSGETGKTHALVYFFWGSLGMLEAIAERLNSDVFIRVLDPKTTIFLCGKALDAKDSLRAKIAQELNNVPFWFRYSIVYPEDLFEELLSGPFHQDLLTLENVLAESVDAVVLVPESYGAVAELGAFADHRVLRRKLVCVQDQRFKKATSFIAYGPLRLLRDLRAGRIVYVDPNNVLEGMQRIRDAISAVKKKTATHKKKGVNAINADRFLLPSIYLFEPVDHRTLQDLVKYASGAGDKNASAIVAAGLSVLRKRGSVVRTPEGYSYASNTVERASEGYRLTAGGRAEFRNMNVRGRWNHYYDPSALDRLRIDLLTRMCRGKSIPYAT